MSAIRTARLLDGALVCGDALACGCGSWDILALQPGTEDETLDDLVGPLGRAVTVARGQAIRAWCETCWAARFGARCVA